MRRDLRVDFFRGVALLVILWDHVVWSSALHPPVFMLVTPAHWGLSDAADVFVFLSGYVYGVVHDGTFARGGLALCARRSVRRAGHLYVANAATLVVCLGIVALGQAYAAPGPRAAYATVPNTMHLALEAPVARTRDILGLSFTPTFFDILPLYIVLLVAAPILFAVLRRSVVAGLAVSVGLYVAAQLGLGMPAAFTRDGSWYLNPFAWQLVFTIGLVAGWKRLRAPSHPAAVAAAVVALVAVALHMHLVPRLVRLGLLAADGWVAAPIPLAGKPDLEPLVLAHFLALACVTAAVTRRAAPATWEHRLVRPLVVTGGRSLEVFCLGVVLTYAGIVLVPMLGGTWPALLGFALLSCTVSIVFAHAIAGRAGAAAARLGPRTPRAAREEPPRG